MAVGCGAKFAKVMLIIFNIIFLCTGIILIALGIWLLVTLGQSFGPSQIFRIASGSYLYRNAAILLTAMGALILVVTILGLVAAIRESKILLSIYLVLLFIIFAGEIAGGVVAIVYKDKLMNSLYMTLSNSLITMTRYYDDPGPCKSSAEGRLWDYVQVAFDCCGVQTADYSYGYYNGYTQNASQLNQCNQTMIRWPNPKYVLPLTCCYHANKIHNFNGDNQNTIMDQYNCTAFTTTGCMDSIQNWIVRFAPVLIGIGIGFGMLEMFGFIFVVCLCMNTDKGFSRF